MQHILSAMHHHILSMLILQAFIRGHGPVDGTIASNQIRSYCRNCRIYYESFLMKTEKKKIVFNNNF